MQNNGKRRAVSNFGQQRQTRNAGTRQGKTIQTRAQAKVSMRRELGMW